MLMLNPDKLCCLNKGKDYISELPDTILCHILSLLFTKFAVKTSILSKRWRYLWTKVPAMDFNEEYQRYEWLNHEQKICFKSFVNKVLLHNDVSYIQRFCLDALDIDDIYVTAWLTNASSREMHKLDISIRGTSQPRISLPPRLLSGEKLMVLKLEGSLIISALMSIHLPNVETIKLDGLKFVDDGSTMRLLSGCPVLKELHIINCEGMRITLDLESLTLESLTIKQEPTDYMLAAKGSLPYFILNTPNVRYLCLQGTLPQYDIGDMCALSEAELNVIYDPDDDDNDDYEDDDMNNRIIALKKVPVDYLAQKLISKLSGVKTLRVGTEVLFSWLRYEDIMKNRQLPAFQNLTYLDIEAGEPMRELLKCAPNLKSLNVRHFDVDYGFPPELAPKHLPSLESVRVESFGGESEYIGIIEYFLESASALKEMYIWLNGSDHRVGNDVFKELLSFPRSSAVCEVQFWPTYDLENTSM